MAVKKASSRVVVLASPEARQAEFPRDRLTLLIEKINEFCTLCNVESPTIVIFDLGGSSLSSSQPGANNAMNTENRLDGGGDPLLVQVPVHQGTAKEEDPVLRELNQKYLLMMEQLREVRKRWLERNGESEEIGSPCSVPIRPLTDFTFDELVALKDWVGDLKEMTTKKMRKLIAEASGDGSAAAAAPAHVGDE